MTDEPSAPELAAELEDLRARLAEAEEVLQAIRNGEVDAVVVTGERGEQVYTLGGADRVYRQLIETMSEGAVTLSADGAILYCNVRFAEMLGRPLDRVLGTALRNYLPPADRQALDAIFAQARTVVARQEINLKNSEGRLMPVYLSASRLQGEGTEMVFCLVLTDLTEQKRQEQIVAAERLARLILEQVAEAIVVCDEQGRVIRASQAAQQFCDGNPLQRPFAEVVPLRTDASDPFNLAPVLQGETLRNVDVVLDRQGQKLELILNAGPLLSGQQILGCVVTLTDITERKQAEKEIASLAKFPSENPYPVLRLSRDGIVMYANAASGALLGMWGCAMGGTIPQFWRDLAAQALARRENKTEDIECNGKVYSMVVTPVAEAGYVNLYARDVTERRRAEEALRESEERVTKTFRFIPDALVISRLEDGKIVEVNDSWHKVFGYSREEVIGKSSLALNLFADSADRQRAIDLLREQGFVRDFELQIRQKSGALRTAILSIELQEIQGEQFMLSVVHDITERKWAEEELENRRNRLNETARMAKVGGWELDVATMKQKWTNETYAIHDREKGVYDPDSTEELSRFEPSSAELIGKAFQEALERGKPYDLEVEMKTIKGNLKWVRAVCNSIMVDGKVKTLRGVVQDITERKQAQEVLRESEARYRTLVENIPQKIFMKDRNYRFVTVNENFARDLGVRPAEFVGKVDYDFFPKELGDKYRADDKRVMETGQTEELEEPYVQRGRETWVNAIKTPVRDNHGEIIGVFGIFWDITDRKRAEEEIRTLNAELEQRVRARTAELSAVNKELEAFTYSVSHDLRAPLRAVDGFSRILLDEHATQLPPETQRYLSLIRSNTLQMGRLVDDLLAFSQLGRKAMIMEHIQPVALAHEAWDLVRGEQGERNVKLTVGDLPSCRGDRALLKQVFVNLLSNALKFTRRRDPAIIEVGCNCHDGEDVFFVRDNGVGFDMLYVGKLFGVFQRLHRFEEYEGTGVGLAIVQRIVHRHGGRVWAEAEPDKGATFFFTLGGTLS